MANFCRKSAGFENHFHLLKDSETWSDLYSTLANIYLNIYRLGEDLKLSAGIAKKFRNLFQIVDLLSKQGQSLGVWRISSQELDSYTVL